MSIAGCGGATCAAADRHPASTTANPETPPATPAAPTGARTAQVIPLRAARAADRPAEPPAGVALARQGARSLADSAARMLACTDKMRASLDVLARNNRVLRDQATRARAIATDAERIAAAIETGDLATLIALRAELGG